MEPTLFVTGDGSHSLKNERVGVSYHSTHGAIQESRHIFIEAGVQPLLAARPARLRILELGFGTGLNALLVRQLAAAHPGTAFDYVTFEPFPISHALAATLNYPRQLKLPAAQLLELHTAAPGTAQQLSDNFRFTKYHSDFMTGSEVLTPASYDVCFFDAFAPEDQPELWSPDVLRRCSGLLVSGGCLVTYCAKGQVRRDLRTAGLRTEKLPGPIGKREITRAWREVEGGGS